MEDTMRTVLVVEDSSAMRGLIASIVDQIDDCEVIEVSGGFQALKELPRTAFALVITDINMPDINGFELISFIRKNPTHKTTPVLVVSSEGNETQKQKCLTLGANAYVSKPFEPAALKAAVEKLLGV
jgi:two-component system, chemotaxis family, chemotaxis protein CheY